MHTAKNERHVLLGAQAADGLIEVVGGDEVPGNDRTKSYGRGSRLLFDVTRRMMMEA